MPYDNRQDRYEDQPTLRQTFGKTSRVITPGASDINPYPKTVFLGASGNITYVPVGNADATTVTLVGLAPGQPVPHRVRRVTSATATVYTVED